MPRRAVRFPVLLAIALVLCVHGWQLPGPVVGQDDTAPRRFALLVGVRQYNRSQLTQLKYTENDVNDLAEVLKQSGYRRVVLMTQTTGAANAQVLPVVKSIRAELKTLLQVCKPEDSVIVAFSGHGVQFKGEKEHYFCPADTNLKDRDTLIPLTDVYDQLQACKAKDKLLLVDACRNDPLSDLFKSAAGQNVESVTKPQLKDPPGGVAALFSCSAGEQSYQSDDLKHGVFFHAVLEGLRGKAANKAGEVGLAGLAQYVQDEVPILVKDHVDRDITQVPELKGQLRKMTLLAARDRREAPPPPPDTKEFTNSIGMKLVLIPAGEFMMGSPASEADRGGDEHQHRVRITKPFFMGIHEVTQDQYEKVVGSNPSNFKGTEFPVERVSWDNAVAFCQKLSDRAEEKRLGRVYRLPTEAEWEYACRGGTTAPFHLGNSLSSTQANFNGKYPYGGAAGGVYREKTTRVGSFAPNKFGLYDMHGNVVEWCQDWFDENYYKNSPAADPQGPSSNKYRVLRGGSWPSGGSVCRAAGRLRYAPYFRGNGDFGFRVVVPSSQRTP